MVGVWLKNNAVIGLGRVAFATVRPAVREAFVGRPSNRRFVVTGATTVGAPGLSTRRAAVIGTRTASTARARTARAGVAVGWRLPALTDSAPVRDSSLAASADGVDPDGAAPAIAVPPMAMAAPTPSVTASPPTRPTQADARMTSKLYPGRRPEQNTTG